MKKRTIIILLVLVFALVLTFALFSFLRREITFVTIPMDVVVSDHIGFNLDRDAVHFGTLVRGRGTGSNAQRGVTISNDYAKTRAVKLYTQGYLAQYVRMSENKFTLGPYSNRSITIYLELPEDVPSGKHNGTLVAEFSENWW